jgi:hypothetical protein
MALLRNEFDDADSAVDYARTRAIELEQRACSTDYTLPRTPAMHPRDFVKPAATLTFSNRTVNLQLFPA